MKNDEENERRLDKLGWNVDYMKDVIRDLPLHKHCPICNRYIVHFNSDEYMIHGDGVGVYYKDIVDIFHKNKQYWLICDVCYNSLKSNQPLHKQVWEKLTKDNK